jgi:hypothetical protein
MTSLPTNPVAPVTISFILTFEILFFENAKIIGEWCP